MRFSLIFVCCCMLIFGIKRSYCAQCNNPLQNNHPTNVTSAEAQRTLSRGMIWLALQFDKVLTKTTFRDSNILFAPVNIIKTLATIMLGAAGETERDLSQVLGVAVGRKLAYNLDILHRELGLLLNKITTEFPGVEFGNNLNIAGGVFIQKGALVCPDFIRLTQQIYRTDVVELDFFRDSNTATAIINHWVANKTQNRITTLLDTPVSRTTKVLVAGALYFNGDWETPFLGSITRWQTFYLGSEGRNSKNRISVQMMANSGVVQYFDDPIMGYESIGLAYKKREVMMFIILPHINYQLKDILSRMNYTHIEDIVKKSVPKEVFYVIPKMKLNSKIDLKGPLQSVGVRSPFSPTRANFTNLSDGVYAEEIIHQVELDVNEIGTTGSAATAISINRGGYNLFRVDRPFVFFIYNIKADIMTFWGSILRPTPFIEVAN